MAYLELKVAETKEIQIESDSAVKELKHWIAGRSYQCTAPDCQYCATGFPSRQRYVVDILWHGSPYKWVVSNTLHAALIAACGGPGKLAHHRFKVTRSGSGFQTKYDLVLLGSTQPLAGSSAELEVPPWESSERKQGDVLTELYEALRDVNAALEVVVERYESYLRSVKTVDSVGEASHGKAKGKAS